MKPTTILAASLVAIFFASKANSQVTQEEVDGVIYQVTRQTVPRSINETRYEQRTYTSYRDRYTTEMQEVQRTYQVPVREQQWVPGFQKTWNVFAPPVMSYRLLPVTRWETRTETVRVPITKRETVPEAQTQQVPVVSQRIVQDEIVHRVAIGVRGNSSVASSTGGTKLHSDPPRDGTAWRPADGSSR